MLKVTDEWLSAAVFISRASASCNSESETSVAAHDVEIPN